MSFTRDYDLIRTALGNTDEKLGDKTCIEAALSTVNMMVMEEWGVHNTCQVGIVCGVHTTLVRWV